MRTSWLLLLGALGVVVAWLLLPAAPNYDTASHLVWANELLNGRAPDVSALAAPTPHPLWLLLAIPAQLSGLGAELMQLLSVTALFVSVACAYRLAAGLAGPLAGVVAAVAVGSSFALLLLAFKAYVDLPFLALVLTAIVLEQERRGGRWAMPLLMFAAGLLRPEAWAYGLLLVVLRAMADAADESVRATQAAARSGWGYARRGAAHWQQARPGAAIVLAAPVLWVLTDWALTGDPLHSLSGTQALAQELGRRTGLAVAPGELLVLLGDLARPPVAAAGLIGVAFAARVSGVRAARLPLTVLAAGCLGFLLVGALGLPLLQRYLLVPAVLTCVFAGVSAVAVTSAARGRPLARSAGTTTTADRAVARRAGVATRSLPPLLTRGVAVVALAGAMLGAGAYLVLKAGSFEVLARGVLQEARWQKDAAALLDQPSVRSAMACGPVTMPTYRFVPELTLRAGLRAGDVVSRASQLGGAGPQRRGVAVVIEGERSALRRLGWAAGVPRTTNAVPPGFAVIARDEPFVVSARC